MSEETGAHQSAGTSLREQALGGDLDWQEMSADRLRTYQDAENRRRASPAMRAITGTPDPSASISWQQVALPGRSLPVRVYRPSAGQHTPSARLPLILHVHGGGFVGTAVQCDWVTSHLAAHLPAVVVSVEHRLLAPDTPLTAAVEDGRDVLEHVATHAETWGIDPERIAVFGESCGALIAALVAISARTNGPRLRAQVLVNPLTEVAESMFDHATIIEYANSPTLTVAQLRLLRKLAVPPGTDPRGLSPLHAGNLDGLPPTLVVIPTHDPLADHGRRYAERLQAAGTRTRITEYPGATHAFLSMPGVIAQADPARAEITEFLRSGMSGDGS